jgi:hypothetical protein
MLLKSNIDLSPEPCNIINGLDIVFNRK